MKRKKAGSSGPKKKKVSKAKTSDYQSGRELARPSMREKKAFDLATTMLTINTIGGGPPVFVTLNACVNGAELYQRVGRKIYMKSLHIRGFVNNTSTSVNDFARIIIFYDAQPNAAAPTIQTLLQDSNAAAATTAYSEINLINRARFKILRDYQIILPSLTNTAGVITNFALQDNLLNPLNINFFIKLKGLEAEYNGVNGGTIADISSGAIFITAVSSISNDNYDFIFTSRLRYYD